MKNNQTRKPKVIVLARSKAWCSVIERVFDNATLCWVLSADDIEGEAARQNANVAIVEIPVDDADNLCVRLSMLANNSRNLKLFAVGDSELYHWRRLLQVAGIAYSCCSILQVDRLAQAVARHLKSVTVSQRTLESQVESDLPWPTAANDVTV